MFEDVNNMTADDKNTKKEGITIDTDTFEESENESEGKIKLDLKDENVFLEIGNSSSVNYTIEEKEKEISEKEEKISETEEKISEKDEESSEKEEKNSEKEEKNSETETESNEETEESYYEDVESSGEENAKKTKKKLSSDEMEGSGDDFLNDILAEDFTCLSSDLSETCLVSNYLFSYALGRMKDFLQGGGDSEPFKAFKGMGRGAQYTP